MKGLLWPLLLALTTSSTPDHDVLFEAMTDELNRSVGQLQIEKHAKPYYVSYHIDDSQKLEIGAQFGALTSDRQSHTRNLTVDVHVGDYKLDSGNMRPSLDEILGTTDSSTSTLSLDDDYDALRHKLWLKTDSAYKHAVQNLERKKAALQQKTVTERPEDWSHEQAFVLIQPKQAFAPDRAAWKTTIKKLSSVFKEFPRIRYSSVNLSETSLTKYFVNSEGSKSRVSEGNCVITATGTAQANDGMKITDSVVVAVSDEKQVPTSEQLAARIKELGRRLTRAIEAKETESYEGPVLMEKEAAADFFSRALAPNVVVKRTFDFDQFMHNEDTQQARIGRRILPTFINVADDPALKDEAGIKWPSSYDVDNEGVAAKRVVLVEKGILKTLLATRLPTLKIKNSNGHAPGGNARAQASNLIIQSEIKLAATDLKKKLLELGKEDGLDYVLIVRKMSWAPPNDPRHWFNADENEFGFVDNQKDKVDLPLAVDICRLYVADGHEEPLRGAAFASSTTKVLRDIVAAGDDAQTYAQADGSMSVTTPSIILRDMELQKAHSEDVDKPPTLPHPYFERQKAD